MRRRTASLLVLAALLPVTGCGDLPQPFRHEGAPPPLTRPKMARGVTVRPVAALPDGQALAEAVVQALEPLEIPATVRGGPAFGHVFEADAVVRDGRHGLQWRLRAPDGAVQDIHFQPLPTAARAGLPPSLRRVQSRETAAALAARLGDGDAAPPPDQPPPKRRTVTLVPFTNLPGDGDRTLTRATRQALERSGLLVADSGADYMVLGTVTVIPGLPGEETVVVAWTVRDGQGRELATIEQEGVVPRGRLDDPWGAMARDIAEGGVVGVLEVVNAASKGQ